jgi:exodeoxyribonuclease V gamma subunit
VIHLHLSNRFEALAARLAERVRAQREAAGIGAFEPVHLLAPNHGVRLGVQLALARHLGLAANVQAVRVDEVVATCLPPEQRGARPVDRAQVQRALLDLLAPGPLLDAPELAPVARYLRHGAPEQDGLDQDAIDRRRVQLAGRLATRFQGYGLSRADLLEGWRAGTTLPSDHPLAATEAWQRRLWLAVEARLAAPAWTSLRDLLASARGCADPTPVAPRAVHVVGFTHLAPLHVEALATAARRLDVHVFALTPCAPDDGCEAFAPRAGEHPGLERWGRVALEQVALWRAAAARLDVPLTVEASHDADATATLLGRLQRSLAARDGWREVTPLPPHEQARDGSLVVHACPDLWREVEVAAGEVWRAVDEAQAAGRTLRFSDVSLVLAGRDTDRYRSAIATVFRQAHRIPVSFADAPPTDADRIVEAVRLLVQLPLGSFTRDELLRLVTHPAIVEAPGDVAIRPDERRARRLEDASRWLEWSEALMVLRGADAGDLDGTYVERDLFSWDQGLRRLALGAFMTGARSRDGRPVAFGEQAYAPLELEHEEVGAAARLTLLVRSLLCDAAFAREGPRPLATWAEFLARLVLSYVVPRDDAEGELRARCAGALRALGELEGDAAVSYRVAAELADEALAGVRPRAHDLAEGVVVSALAPSRPWPFRVTIVLGLNEGQVPRAPAHDDLDLRRVERRAGDADPGDLDAAALLELVLSTRERLLLSYVARDAQTGASLAPSSFVRELEHVLRETGLCADPRALLTERHPLRRYAPHVVAGTLPGAVREHRAHALRQDLELHLAEVLPGGLQWPSPGELRRALAPALRARLDALLDGGRPPAPSGGTGTRDGAARVSISSLAKFLESPLQAWAAHRLRLAQEEEGDVLARTDEPFSCSALDGSALLRAAFAAALVDGDRASPLVERALRAHEDLLAAAELDGRAPTGVFLEKVAADHQRILARWAEGLDALGVEPDAVAAYRARRFGPAFDEGHGPAPVEHEPLRLRVALPAGEREVLITGRTALLDPACGASLTLASGSPSERHLLRAFVEALVLGAAGLLPAGPLRAQLVAGDGQVRDAAFAVPDAAAAAAHLRLLVQDLLTGAHDHLLPGDVALGWVRERRAAGDGASIEPLVARVRGLRDDPHRRSADEFGPLRRTERLDPPADAEAIALRRLGPLVDWTGA